MPGEVLHVAERHPALRAAVIAESSQAVRAESTYAGMPQVEVVLRNQWRVRLGTI